MRHAVQLLARSAVLIMAVGLSMLGCTAEPGADDECLGCFQDGLCLAGDEPAACGEGGAECTACAGDEVCIDGVCHEAPTCNAETCPGGCCDQDGECVTGDSSGACGGGGQPCQTCSAGSSCDGGACKADCSAANCLGCCMPDGTCAVGDDVDDDACGASGEACSTCGDGLLCSKVIVFAGDGRQAVAGQCAPEDCGGCSECCSPKINLGGGAICGLGTSQDECGAKGTVCETCSEDETCLSRACTLVDSAFASIMILSVDVPMTDHDGVSWDHLSPPDPYVRVWVGDSLEEHGRTSTVNDTTAPVYNEVVGPPATVERFRTGIAFDVYDSDVFSDDLMITGLMYEPVQEDFAGLSGSGGRVREVKSGPYTIRFRFVR